MPPKAKNSAKSKKTRVVADTKKRMVQQPNWTLFTGKQIAFTEKAAALDAHLKMVYGQQATITKFGKALVEIQKDPTLKAKVQIDQKLALQFSEYLQVKEERESELRSFRTDSNIESFDAAVESFTEIPKNEMHEELQEE
jgi:hypothetical protein